MSRRSSKSGASARSAARLAAVQALYQIDMTPEALPAQVVDEFAAHRLGKELEGDLYAEADRDMFKDLVTGVCSRLEEIDGALAPRLSEDWPIHRLEKLMAAILHAGVYELIARPDVPTKVIINEYLDVAHAFYAGSEPRFVNGVLDKIARDVRS